MLLPAWACLHERFPELIERLGASLCSAEPVWDGDSWLHITAAARVWNRERTHFFQVWSAKAGRFQLPGAHGEGDFDIATVALREARRALGADAGIHPLGATEVVGESIAEYWNTPAHDHLQVVYEFWLAEEFEPSTGRWEARGEVNDGKWSVSP